MFCPISVDDFINKHIKINLDESENSLRSSLIEAAESKKNGAKCMTCGQPIWAIGSAIVGWNGCFTCISGEADCSDDYEIESVCFR